MRATCLIAATFSAAALTGLSPSASAQALHDLSAIDHAVTAFTGAAPGSPGGAQAPVDRQMRLNACRQPLQLEYFGQASAIRVSCPDAGSWRVFVPLMQARSAAPGPAAKPLVARRDALRVEAGGDGFRISRSGEALEDGAAGQLIRVKIDDGTRQGRIITAQVIEAGRVRVPTG